MRYLYDATLAALLLAVCPAALAQPYELQYDPATGNVQIDTLDPSNKLRSYLLRSTNSQMIPGNRNRVLAGEVTQTDFSSQIFITSPLARTPGETLSADPTLAPVIDGTRWNLGNILPTGLTLQEVTTDLSVPFPSVYSPGPGTSPNDPFTITIVPEPASLPLIALGGLALLRRRRGSA